MLGLTLLEGRLLDERDARATRTSSPSSSIVPGRGGSFPNGSAVGKRFREGGCTDCPWTTVVGVVSEVKYAGWTSPTRARSTAPLRPARCRATSCCARRPIRDQPVPSMRQSCASSTRACRCRRRDGRRAGRAVARAAAVAVAAGRAFALVALVLSVVGIYGVMAYYVQQHTKDISIRLALGGTPGDVLRLIVGQGMKVVSAASSSACWRRLASTRLMASLLFGVGAADAATSWPSASPADGCARRLPGARSGGRRRAAGGGDQETSRNRLSSKFSRFYGFCGFSRFRRFGTCRILQPQQNL